MDDQTWTPAVILAELEQTAACGPLTHLPLWEKFDPASKCRGKHQGTCPDLFGKRQ